MGVLKDAMSILLLEFTHLMNECLNSSVMPKSWKIGTVTPIPKGSASLNVGEYRPVSVLPCPSKVLERIVYNQLVYFSETNALLDKRQHGFRKGFSTASAIMEVTDFLYESIDNGCYVHCAFIDYSKAFDTLNHDILFVKLNNLGIGKGVLDWCKDYLSNRFQSVKLGNEKSPLLPITCGVPQGSILGPLYFIIYVNDLLEEFIGDEVGITLYADDTVLYTKGRDSKRAVQLLNRGLEKLSTWCINNKLAINVKKTKHLVLSPPHRAKEVHHVMLNGEPLDTVRNYNYLGVIIDDCLTFENFLKEKGNKMNARIYQLGKLRKFLTSDIACHIYKQTILPTAEYADLIVESGPPDKVSRLQRLQDKAIRIIDNGRHGNLDVNIVSNLYRISPLNIRRAEHLGLVMYRLRDDVSRLETNRPAVHLRGRNKIKFKRYKRNNEKYLRSIFSRGVTIWDRIPESVQRSTTKVKFKHAIVPYLSDLIRPILR